MKKAELQVTLKNLVLLVILLVILITVTYKEVLPFISDDAKLKICKTSVFAASKKIPVIQESLFEVDCEMPTQEISEDDVQKQIYSEDKKVYRAVANHLVTCWDMIGKGQLEGLNEELADNTACLLCMRISFENDVEEEKISLGTPFQTWLGRNTPRLNEKKYVELLPPLATESSSLTVPEELTGDDSYYILLAKGPSIHLVSQKVDFSKTCLSLYN